MHKTVLQCKKNELDSVNSDQEHEQNTRITSLS